VRHFTYHTDYSLIVVTNSRTIGRFRSGVPKFRNYHSKIASNSFTGKVNTQDYSALC